MMRLLVSVRDADEARIALAAGVDLIDVKEPLRGALGAADAEQIAAVVQEINGRVPVSAALGELFAPQQKGVGGPFRSEVDYEFPTDQIAKWTPDPLAVALAGIQFAKFGLAGATKFSRWRETWAAAIEQLPGGVKNVAVAYADWRTCYAPSPGEVIDQGVALGCAAILIDTYDKTRGGLLEQCPLNELNGWLEIARERNLLTVVGGSLDCDAIRTIAPLRPDFVAVRTAVCETHRAGRMDEIRVKNLVRLISDLNARTRLKTHEKLLDRPCKLG